MDWSLHCRKSITKQQLKILHRTRLRKYNLEKPPEDNYQEAQWQTDDNIVVPQDDLYTIAWETEFDGHLFDIPIIYNDPNAIDFDESHTQGPDTVIVPRSYFHDSSDGQNWETCPTSHPTLPQTLMPKSNGQSQDIETSTDLTQNDNAKHISDSSTDAEITCKPVTQPPIMESDTSSTLDINNPTAENIPKKESNSSRGGKYNLRPKPILITQKNTDFDVRKILFLSPLFVCHFCPLFYLLHTHHSLLFSLSFWGIYKITKNVKKTKFTQQRNSKPINKYNDNFN